MHTFVETLAALGLCALLPVIIWHLCAALVLVTRRRNLP